MSQPTNLDPDIRFLLANERTLLAWIRTALALLAGGLAFTQFDGKTPAQTNMGLTIMGLGAIVALIGYSRFRAADRAIRSNRLPKPGYGPILQVGAVVLITVALLASHLFGWW
jgi:putative membrane protein